MFQEFLAYCSYYLVSLVDELPSLHASVTSYGRLLKAQTT